MLIKNDTEFEAGVSQVHSDHIWAGKYPGVRGNGLRVEVCDSSVAWNSNVNVTHGGGSSAHASINATGTGVFFTIGNANATLKIVGSGSGISNTDLSTLADAVQADLNVGDLIQTGNSSIGEQKLSIKSFAGSDTFAVDGGVATLSRVVTFDSRYTLGSDFDTQNLQRFWKYFNSFDNAPGTSAHVEDKGGAGDELHIVIVDEDGDISGTKNTILETYPAVSRATDAKNESGESIFFKTKIDDGSSWAYSIAHPGGASYSNTAANMAALSLSLIHI